MQFTNKLKLFAKKRQKTHRFEPFGVLLASVGAFLIAFGFIESPKYGWWTRLAKGPFNWQAPFGLSTIPVAIFWEFLFPILTLFRNYFLYFCSKRP